MTPVRPAAGRGGLLVHGAGDGLAGRRRAGPAAERRPAIRWSVVLGGAAQALGSGSSSGRCGPGSGVGPRATRHRPREAGRTPGADRQPAPGGGRHRCASSAAVTIRESDDFGLLSRRIPGEQFQQARHAHTAGGSASVKMSRMHVRASLRGSDDGKLRDQPVPNCLSLERRRVTATVPTRAGRHRCRNQFRYTGTRCGLPCELADLPQSRSRSAHG